MNELEKVICNDVMADHQYVVDLRRYFHMNPETAKEEFGTAKRIEEELDKLGIEHKRVGETGVYAEIKGNLAGDKTIVLRADIDALDVEEAHVLTRVLYLGKCMPADMTLMPLHWWVRQEY